MACFVNVLTPLLPPSWGNGSTKVCGRNRNQEPVLKRASARGVRNSQSRPNVRNAAATAPGHVVHVKRTINELAGSERGIFGLDRQLRSQIHASIEAAEALSPTSVPTADDAALANGIWRLLYTTLTILGRRRVRLAIATKSKTGFVELGDLYQAIDSSTRETRNVVVFKLAIGGSGSFTVTADYQVASDRRVNVQTKSSVLAPRTLDELLGSNIELLSEIFDPTGFLDITYLDEHLRVGRDDKGNIFVLERCDDVDLDSLR